MPEGIYFAETDSVEIYNTIISELEQGVGEPLYPGDERRIFGEALVPLFVALYNTLNDAARQTLLKYARGQVLDGIGERVDTKRLEGTASKTVLRFTVSDGAPANVTIPEGTRATADGMVYFSTVEEVVLKAGNVSADIVAIASEIGVKYNDFPIGSISSMVDLIPYVSKVSNITTTAGGDDGEPYTEEGDDRYRERIILGNAKKSTAGPAMAYEYWGMSADASISNVRAVMTAPGEVTVYPLMNGGKIPSEEILKKVYDIVTDESIRPLTDLVHVSAPTIKYFDIEVKYYTGKTVEASVIETIEGTGGAIERYIEWQTLAIGRDINPDQLRKLMLAPNWENNLTGAYRVDVVKPIFESVDESEVAQFSGNIKISHEIVLEATT